TSPAAFHASDRQPFRRGQSHASAAYGTSSGHDMWICTVQTSAAPISANASGSRIVPLRKTGTASKKPMKNAMAGTSRYDVLMMSVENSIVQSSVISQPQTSHAGSGIRTVMYQANAATAAIDIRLIST